MSGTQFLALLRGLPAEERDLPIDELVDRYNQSLCDDCGRHHHSPYEALVCDEMIDARSRKNAARRHRRAGAGLDWDDQLEETSV